MPMINVTLSGPSPEPAVIHRLQAGVTRLMQDILRKEAALTVVNVLHLPPGASSANGQPVGTAASLQAMITAGTNSAAEKADFIFAAKSLLTVEFGPSAAPIYVVLHEIPAESWGYDGQTQAARKAGRLIGGAA
ncbi:MAG: 4-oxalocrotonate tautomerase [Proteobacteria bacterium]|nr:4-oxalocrotonate tautomerase [Pseudomonadota bacterium]